MFMNNWAQTDIEALIVSRMRHQGERLAEEYSGSHPVKHVVIDDLLPEELALTIGAGFPDSSQMKKRQSIRERKSTSANYRDWDEQTKGAFFALQGSAVMAEVSRITGIEKFAGDPSGYAGGLSSMEKEDFLNPHIDNSTHPELSGYRRLNLLYYVSPNWKKEFGGNLELWSKDMSERLEVVSQFNRLVIMATTRQSLHSVSRVLATEKNRLCLSNYYFNQESPESEHYQHITAFRGRPDEPIKDLYLRLEGFVASKVQGLVGKPLVQGEVSLKDQND
jgi:Rps23 Pro-64 3,4-dihydroxylase Tpa1-like proline 4-hydroxylase